MKGVIVMTKKVICAALAAITIGCTAVPASAGTIEFTVTVGGTGTQDPLSKKELKSNDGDKYAYFTGKTFSTTGNSIKVKSYKKSDTSVHTTSYVYLSSGNIGTTFKRLYNTTAEGNTYYYMKAEAAAGRVKVTGNYCP